MEYWNPKTVVSRGMITVGVAPNVADMKKPTLAEMTASSAITCSITEFTAESEVDSESVDWLCNLVSESLPGTTTHSVDDLLIKVGGQDVDNLANKLHLGEEVYLWRRDGISSSEDVKTGQKVWIWKVVFSSLDPSEGDNTFIGVTAHVSVLSRSDLPVAIVNSEPSEEEA